MNLFAYFLRVGLFLRSHVCNFLRRSTSLFILSMGDSTAIYLILFSTSNLCDESSPSPLKFRWPLVSSHIKISCTSSSHETKMIIPILLSLASYFLSTYAKVLTIVNHILKACRYFCVGNVGLVLWPSVSVL